ncbi:sugar ABC transporter ATP-binding protein [Novosphingobium sp. MW5]|nr:sugar ABC transporter ATP-binding protein [Novosphingobium sp. MW5]
MIVLRAENVSRRFGGTLALDGVDFDVHAGAVNVLIGENGAGKSTLMRIFAGADQPTSGRLLLEDAEVSLRSVREAARLGIGIVHQELNLCPNLTVAENIFLTTDRAFLLDRDAERRAVTTLLERIGPGIDPEARVSSLRVGQQQIVEIARALAEEVRVLILDEPTSALSASEVDVLFGVIAELKRKGTAIIYISHRLEELVRIGDHVTVLRDGRRVAHSPMADVSVPRIVEQMLGEPRATKAPGAGKATKGQAVISVRGLAVYSRTQGGTEVNLERLDIHGGEVTAVYGLLGSGRTELLEALSGLRPSAGDILLEDKPVNGLSPAECVRAGILLVPEDRQRDGLFANLSVGQNMSLSSLAEFSRFGTLDDSRERGEIDAMIARLRVRTASQDTPVMALSGGNQQKVVIGRCLMAGPRAILLDEPGRGVDIGARGEIFEIVRELAGRGMAVLFATSDLHEALDGADRILVMAQGRVTADLSAAEADEPRLVAAANAAPTPTMETV